MRGRIWMWTLLGAAVALVLVGGGLLLLAPTSMGWFTCSSSLGGTRCSFDGLIPVTPARAAGALSAIAGLLITVGLVGWVLGRRSGLREPPRRGEL